MQLLEPENWYVERSDVNIADYYKIYPGMQSSP